MLRLILITALSLQNKTENRQKDKGYGKRQFSLNGMKEHLSFKDVAPKRARNSFETQLSNLQPFVRGTVKVPMRRSVLLLPLKGLFATWAV